ncbi:MAG TPA: pyrroline-5-carboxylate reductase [Casimicrobiaceae bacterium]|nr:pyrroline-5-carboxylate reductase [Casimicrobiaceae bacterium]
MSVTAFIGGGNMASALAGGMLARGARAEALRVVEPLPAQRAKLAARFPGVALYAEATGAAVAGADVVVLAVKPQQMSAAARALAPHLGADSGVVLSIAAGIRLVDLGRWLGGYRQLVRAMPNTPALVGRGISGAFAAPGVDARARDRCAAVLEAGGKIVWVGDEAMLDAVTGVSGSGPAYVFYFLEALETAARELGFSAADARALAYATFDGAVALAQASAEDPAALRAQVTSKGGTTERAIAALEDGDVRARIVAAVKAAAARARELGDELGRNG